jgi:hypothetical protein
MHTRVLWWQQHQAKNQQVEPERSNTKPHSIHQGIVITMLTLLTLVDCRMLCCILPQQHLHTLDPTRAQALVNKDDDVLLSSYCVPSCWWNPVPNRGMEYDVINGRGVWMRKEQLDDMKAQQKKA